MPTPTKRQPFLFRRTRQEGENVVVLPKAFRHEGTRVHNSTKNIHENLFA
jgi:hypothetical protein